MISTQKPDEPKCGYLDSIIEADLFSKKEFIKNKIVNPWLKIILDKLIKEEFETFHKEVGASVKAYYSRSSTWENIQKKFEMLKYTLDKELIEIFPLNLS